MNVALSRRIPSIISRCKPYNNGHGHGHGRTINKKSKSTFASPTSSADDIFERAIMNASSFDQEYNYNHERLTVPHAVRCHVQTIKPEISSSESSSSSSSSIFSTNTNAHKSVPSDIIRPPYAETGDVPHPPYDHVINDEQELELIRKSARLARDVLDLACSSAKVGMTTDEVDDIVHQAIIDAGAYPSPLNYHGFPKSVCSSINEVICHGIPDQRRMKKGDLASFDVSCFLNGLHGDNCASVVIGDDNHNDNDANLEFSSTNEEQVFLSGRRLIQATQEALDAAIATCRHGSCLTEIGAAISSVSDAYGYSSVEKYTGHGVGRVFHSPPFVKHYRNHDYFMLETGMVFTIEPMIVEARHHCVEWASDGWTVVTRDGGRSAQFEHMIAITDDGAEILTVPTPDVNKP